MSSLIAENLTYSYSSKIKPALSNVSLKLEQGTLTALVGPNGAGKSTLLSLLQGSSKPDQGEITVDGKPLINNRFQVALMPQRGKLNWNFPITVEGLVALGRVNHSKSTCCELEAALQRVGISHLAKRRLDALSGGQQQRALLAKTLMNPAKIFLLDEPCSAFDPPTLHRAEPSTACGPGATGRTRRRAFRRAASPPRRRSRARSSRRTRRRFRRQVSKDCHCHSVPTST